MQRWGLGTAVGALLGLIGGNFLLQTQSAALAQALNERFGSNWFFHDLLAGSLSPLGAMLGLLFGFVLLDLPFICLRQWHRDALHDALLQVQADVSLQEAICALAGSMASSSPLINLNQRACFLALILRAVLPLNDETLKRYELIFWQAARQKTLPDDAIKRLLNLKPERDLRALSMWISSRLLDLALADFDFSYQEEARFWALIEHLPLMHADIESMLQLRLSALSEYRPTMRERMLGAALWPDPQVDTAAHAGKEGKSTDFSAYTQAPFDEEAALQAAKAAKAQGRTLSLSEAYIVLGLPYGAPVGAVKRRYRQLMFKYHPDHISTHDPATKERAALICLEIKLAYELILGS
ncbi:MAG: J domain-containing protein [Candidatus Anaerobiospirillum merdipullorum]|uniref:J domain-containing protein n=1 Tax=Candidatus Anaerobiospirillum merdipullorum TaxID=2838450 RepID=A0A9E2KMJ2_9GAMM|nr:J domain-containing protein [Candidatus Anaerobiospirillum merdipullorum]